MWFFHLAGLFAYLKMQKLFTQLSVLFQEFGL
jgi:hypothetical protein